MTTQQLIDYYTALLILQYKEKPKAKATIGFLVSMFIMDQLPTLVQSAFTLGTAVGVQLDVLGKYAGVIRSGNGPQGPITLDDADFTQFIQLAIIKNSSNGSLASIDSLLETYFPGEIFVFDYRNMRMSYYINSSVGSQQLAELFVSEGLLPKPLGVQLGATIYSPLIGEFFGCREYAYPAVNASPLNDYASYNMNYPMLDYNYVL